MAESVWLDDDDHMRAWYEGDCLWIEPCGLGGVMLRPEQQRRLHDLLSNGPEDEG